MKITTLLTHVITLPEIHLVIRILLQDTMELHYTFRHNEILLPYWNSIRLPELHYLM